MGLFTLILILNIDGQYTSTALQRDLDVTTCKREMNFLMKDKIQGRIFLPTPIFKNQTDAQRSLQRELEDTQRDKAFVYVCVPQGIKE